MRYRLQLRSRKVQTVIPNFDFEQYVLIWYTFGHKALILFQNSPCNFLRPKIFKVSLSKLPVVIKNVNCSLNQTETSFTSWLHPNIEQSIEGMMVHNLKKPGLLLRVSFHARRAAFIQACPMRIILRQHSAGPYFKAKTCAANPSIWHSQTAYQESAQDDSLLNMSSNIFYN